MIDFTTLKKLVIPEGVVRAISRTIDNVVLWKSDIKNWVKYSTESDGTTIYNNNLGYKNNTRLNSSADEVDLTGYVTFGYIPVKANDVIRVKGVDWNDGDSNCYLWYYDSTYTQQKYFRPDQGTEDIIMSNGENGEIIFTIKDYVSSCAYIRLCAKGFGETAIITVNEEIPYSLKNWVQYSMESGGTAIYNGGLGYKNGYRIRSGGAEGELSTSAHTGFIPVKGGDIIRISGGDFSSTNSHGSAMNVADGSFTNIGQFSMQSGEYGIFKTYTDYSKPSVVEEKTGVWKWVVPPEASGVKYIRVSCNAANGGAADGAKLIVTINEEII